MANFLRSQSRKPRNANRPDHQFADLETHFWDMEFLGSFSFTLKDLTPFETPKQQPIAAHCTDHGVEFHYG